MKYKKVVATVLSLAMAVSTLPMSVLAEETEGSTEESSEVVETVDEEVDAEEGEGNDGEASDKTPAEESSAGDVSVIPDEPNDTNEDEQEINVSSGKIKTYNAGEADTMSWNDFKAGVDNTLSGETYTLQADVIKTSGSGSFSIDNKFIEIDLNGHTIDASQDDNDMFYINGDGLVTIKNGTLIGSTKGLGEAKCIAGDASVNLEDLEISSFKYAIASTGDVWIDNCTITKNDYAVGTNISGVEFSHLNFKNKVIIRDNNHDLYLGTGDLFEKTYLLTEGSSIGIEMQEPGLFTGELSPDEQKKISYFFSHDEGYYVKVVDKKFSLVSSTVEVDSWQALLNAVADIPGKGTVKLTDDCVCESGAAEVTIVSPKDITIDLNGNKIDRNQKGRVIEVKSGATLTIRDSSDDNKGLITGGKRSDNGAGIYNNGTLNIQGGMISGNNLSSNDSINHFGAGVYNNRGTVNISGGFIINNNDNVTIDYHHYGGGIYNSNGTVNISGGTIIGNNAYEGAGIYNGGTLMIEGGNISRNTATGISGSPSGGGIYNAGTTTVTGGSFEYNSAKGDGGAIYNEVTLVVAGKNTSSRILFSNNSARNGGAIANSVNNMRSEPGTADIKNAYFEYNTSSSNGGALYNFHTYVTSTEIAYATCKLEDDFFLYNKATGNGGAIYNAGNLEIVSSRNPNDITTPNGCGANTANKGGAIYNEHELSIKNWAARNNSASDGGGIYTTSNINLDGKIIITGNTKDESANNLLFTENVRLVIKEGFSDSEIGVTAGFDTGVDSYTFTDGYNKAGKTEVAYFTADAINEAIVLSNSNPKELQIHTYQPNTITGADMTIAESLSFRFSIRLGDMIDKDSAYIAVKGPNDAEPRRVELTPDSTGICVVPCSLYARQFDSEIKYMLADKNGLQKMVMGTTAYDYYCITANQYLTALKEGDYSEEAKKLADAMLVYGAFAEKYFASSDEDTRVGAIAELANNKLNFNSATRGLNVYSNIDTDSFSSYKPGVYQGTGSDTVGIRGENAGLGHNIGYDSISLVAKDKIALRLYFHGDITNADFEIFRTKMSGRSLSDGQTGDITDYVVGQDHGLYYIEIPDIAAYDLGTYIYVEFLTHYNGGSAGQPTFNNPKRALAYGIEVNPLSYAYAVMYVHGGSFKGHSDVYISKALLRYYEDAKAYKEATNQ